MYCICIISERGSGDLHVEFQWKQNTVKHVFHPSHTSQASAQGGKHLESGFKNGLTTKVWHSLTSHPFVWWP